VLDGVRDELGDEQSQVRQRLGVELRLEPLHDPARCSRRAGRVLQAFGVEHGPSGPYPPYGFGIDMNFEVERREDEVRVLVRGELDADTGPPVEDELRRAAADAVRRVVLDLREVSFFDSTGLQIVLDADIRARERGHAFTLVATEGEPLRILRLAEVDERLHIEIHEG
jgi:anti-anti-sigma factor